jgi:hypothetical protein
MTSTTPNNGSPRRPPQPEPAEPAGEFGEIVVSKGFARVNTVKQRLSFVLRRNPEAVHSADLVIDPTERAVAGPRNYVASLPVQAAWPHIGEYLWPPDHRQPR